MTELFYLVILYLKIIKYSIMEITNEIKDAIVCLLMHKIIVQSWGITNIKLKNNEIRFEVNGLLFQGIIIIKYLGNKQYLVRYGQQDIRCELFQLVLILDRIIEADDNYLENLKDIVSIV